MPILKAKARADRGRRGSATAFGVQGFAYTGAPVRASFSYTLSGAKTDNDVGYTSNFIEASLAVAIVDEIPWFPSFGTLVFEIIEGEGAPTTTDELYESARGSRRTGSMSFDLAPGDNFFLIMDLSVNAQNGVADAFSTLTGSLTDASGAPLAGLEPASARQIDPPPPAPVPLPAASWLLASALVGLAGLGRARRV